MNGADAAVIIVVLISAGIGLIRGFTKEILSVVSWLGAGMGTFIALPLAQHLARQHIANPMIADIATAVVVFILFLIIFSLISHFLSGLVRQSALGGIDRSLGFGFGVLRGIVFLCLLEIAMGCFVARSHQPSSIKDSRFSSLIYQGSDFLFQISPPSLCGFITQQQQRRVSEAGSEGTSVVNEMVGVVVQDQLQKHLQPESPVPLSKEALQQEAQRAAETLSKLKPKAAEQQNSATYSKKQRQDMERLLSQEELAE